MNLFKWLSVPLMGVLLLSNACKNGSPVSAPVDASASPAQASPARVLSYTYEVVKSYPHDPNAFTQGLVYDQGVFYESTGLNGASSLRRVEIETGRVLKKVDVSAAYFAEGLALLKGRLYQLTWQSQQAFVYSQDSFERIDSFNYSGEGWGLTHDGASLIMSDGSDQIRFLDPDTFRVLRTIDVQDNGRAIRNLNELEYIKGEIYANIWQTDRVARIDPKTGRVVAWVNLTGLLAPEDRTGGPVDVLNGIAYDPAGDRLFVTGKLWPKVYEIKLKAPRNDVQR